MLQAGDYHFGESVNQRFRYPQDFDQNRYRAYLQAAGARIQAHPEDRLASLDAAVPDADGISLRQGGVRHVRVGVRMLNPPHPGEFVRTEIIEPLGLTVAAAAAVLGVSRPTLSTFLNGRSDLSGTMALRIEKAFGVKMDTLREHVARIRGIP